ncbi:MAG: transglycosylase SLT domain-containing protein [Bacteroidota bacterium]
MKNNGPFPRPYQAGKRYVVLSIPMGFPRLLKMVGLLTAIVAGTNFMTYRLATQGILPADTHIQVLATSSEGVGSSSEQLYLLDKAQIHVPDATQFADKVRDVSGMLGVAPEWLMAVMYLESKFDASVYNYKGSGAVGLIQFMPSTALDMNITSYRLSQMNHLQQLEYVYMYLDKVKQRNGAFKSLTDLYLGILYPKARGQESCYTLFSRPSKAYRQNSGLDENRDGRVTVGDIDRRLQRLFPTAHAIQLTEV